MINAPAPAKLSTLACDDSKVSRPDVSLCQRRASFQITQSRNKGHFLSLLSNFQLNTPKLLTLWRLFWCVDCSERS